MTSYIYSVDIPHELSGGDTRITTLSFATEELANDYVEAFNAVFEAQLASKHPSVSTRDWLRSYGTLRVRKQEVHHEEATSLAPVRVFFALSPDSVPGIVDKGGEYGLIFVSRMYIPSIREYVLEDGIDFVEALPDGAFVHNHIIGSSEDIVTYHGTYYGRNGIVAPATFLCSLDEELLHNDPRVQETFKRANHR